MWLGLGFILAATTAGLSEERRSYPCSPGGAGSRRGEQRAEVRGHKPVCLSNSRRAGAGLGMKEAWLEWAMQEE